jgi:hypothetical protein
VCKSPQFSPCLAQALSTALVDVAHVIRSELVEASIALLRAGLHDGTHGHGIGVSLMRHNARAAVPAAGQDAQPPGAGLAHQAAERMVSIEHATRDLGGCTGARRWRRSQCAAREFGKPPLRWSSCRAGRFVAVWSMSLVDGDDRPYAAGAIASNATRPAWAALANQQRAPPS